MKGIRFCTDCFVNKPSKCYFFRKNSLGPNTDLSMLELTSANMGEREVYLFEVLD